MGLTNDNKTNIVFKLAKGKAQTQETYAEYEEFVPSEYQLSLDTIFAQQVDPLPISNGGLTNLYDTDNIVERVKFELEILPDTEISINTSQAYRLKLPADYTVNGYLNNEYSGGTILYNSKFDLQIVPSKKGEGLSEYVPTLYETDGITVIPEFSEINWQLDTSSGILWIQDPPEGYDLSANRPGFLEAFLYVGEYANTLLEPQQKVKIITGSTYNILDTDNNYFIGFSGTSTVNLPSNPSVGFSLKLNDLSNNSLSSPITINGNGNIIHDDTFALINTNLGSITLLFNGLTWSVVAFTP